MPRPDRHREPGTLFLRLVRACCREWRVEQIFEPAVADLQHECREASGRLARLRARWRGAFSLGCLLIVAPFVTRGWIAHEPAEASRPNGSPILLLLATALYLGTLPLFGGFSMLAWAAGLTLALVLRRWHFTHPSTPVDARVQLAVPVPEINLYSISVGGDAAGLIFAAGSMAILVVGVPQFAWYLAAAALTAVVFAVWLHARRALEMRAPTRLVSISSR